MYDIAVIGGGPAGLSAAAQGRARGRSVLVVSGDIRDNPLYKTERIDNYLGFYNVTGARLLDQYGTSITGKTVTWTFTNNDGGNGVTFAENAASGQ